MAVQKASWTKINDKVCCTCEYWNGERELQFLAGTRLNAILSYSNPGAAYCPTYKRWHKLP